MSVSNSKLAYDDCYTVLDQALESTEGIRVGQASSGSANHYVARLNYARVIDRQLQAEVSGEPSPYDLLLISRPRYADGKWWIYIQRRDVENLIIEDLGAAE